MDNTEELIMLLTFSLEECKAFMEMGVPNKHALRRADKILDKIQKRYTPEQFQEWSDRIQEMINEEEENENKTS